LGLDRWLYAGNMALAIIQAVTSTLLGDLLVLLMPIHTYTRAFLSPFSPLPHFPSRTKEGQS
jgi:hypothetical protein